MSVSIARKYIRAAPDPQESVQIDLSLDGDFEFQFTALVVEEAPMGGCSIACLKSIGLKNGSLCRIKIGHLAPFRSEVVWEKELDEKLVRLGIKFLE